ncbi:hypothetical protein [Gluconobacter cerinus]|uniref:hypothetical protein n=1 Tax=Gluconobacter cerinus TaxID=38307 RepID=UPI001B8BFFE5|nr:hypothetical protein [Gluconobacter cerinus]MBS1038062.1 hypothetical protein [Gluconobacter cerinus]
MEIQDFNKVIELEGKSYSDEIYSSEEKHNDLEEAIFSSWYKTVEKFNKNMNYLVRSQNEKISNALFFDYPISIDFSCKKEGDIFSAISLIIFPFSEEMNFVADDYLRLESCTQEQFDALRELQFSDLKRKMWVAGFPPPFCTTELCQSTRKLIKNSK